MMGHFHHNAKKNLHGAWPGSKMCGTCDRKTVQKVDAGTLQESFIGLLDSNRL